MPKPTWTTPQKRGKFVSIFLLYISISMVFLVLSQTTFGKVTVGALDSSLRPFQKGMYSLFGSVQAQQDSSSEVAQLRKENQELRIALAKQQELEREIAALQDQFATTELSTQELLPSHIVGITSFIPGFSIPSEMILDKGTRDGVQVGQVVVSKNILLGRVTSVAQKASKVELTTSEKFSLTAKTAKTNALGVLRGQGSGMMILENVLLTDTLTKDDLVVTKGSINGEGIGSPPDLVLGKIISINKKASELFQSAEIAPLIDVTRLKTVFILEQS